MATIQSVKSKIQGLIDKSNQATGGSDTDLTTAIDNLIANQGGGALVEKSVNFWDYDGTLLYSYTLDEAKSLVALPSLPIYDSNIGFTAIGWTMTLDQVKAIEGFCDICVKLKGTNTSYPYIAVFVVEVPKGAISINAYKKSGSAYINWGDGGTSAITSSSVTAHTHTYANAGKYTILVYASSSSAYLGGSTLASSAFYLNPHVLLSAYILDFSILANTFGGSYNLEFAYSNKSSNHLFANCHNLRLIIGESVRSNHIRDNCYNIERAYMDYPLSDCFINNYGLKKLVLTSSNEIYSLPPALEVLILTASSVAIYNAVVPCDTYGTKIYVNDDLVDSYKSATGWSDHANYIFPISSYTDE